MCRGDASAEVQGDIHIVRNRYIFIWTCVCTCVEGLLSLKYRERQTARSTVSDGYACTHTHMHPSDETNEKSCEIRINVYPHFVHCRFVQDVLCSVGISQCTKRLTVVSSSWRYG